MIYVFCGIYLINFQIIKKIEQQFRTNYRKCPSNSFFLKLDQVKTFSGND